MVFDQATHLPYLLHSYENRSFFGPSTHDLLLYDYTTVNGIRFPRRFKNIYNREHPLMDYLVADVLSTRESTRSASMGLPAVSQSMRRGVTDWLEKANTGQPTHYYHDHAYGIVDYVAAGAKIIALDEAVSYYSASPGDRFVTYSLVPAPG